MICRLLVFFFRISLFLTCSCFFGNDLSENISRVTSSLDPDHALRFVVPDLGPYCFQM